MNKFEKVDRCVILMAGLGTRFLPATKAVAKELFPIENKPALLYHLREIYNSGIRKVCIVISKEKEHVKTFLSHDEKLEEQLRNSGKIQLLDELNEIIDNMQIDFVYQGEMNGNGGAVYSVKNWCEGRPFGLLFGDDLCRESKGKTPVIGQLISAYEKTGKCIVGAKQFPMELIHLYSSIVTGNKLFERCHSMQSIIEKPEKAQTNLVGLARYVLTAEIFEKIPKCPKHKNEEVYLTDAINVLASEGKAACYKFDAKYYDCGNKLEYIKCILDFALEDKEISQKLKEYLKTII